MICFLVCFFFGGGGGGGCVFCGFFVFCFWGFFFLIGAGKGGLFCFGGFFFLVLGMTKISFAYEQYVNINTCSYTNVLQRKKKHEYQIWTLINSMDDPFMKLHKHLSKSIKNLHKKSISIKCRIVVFKMPPI